MAIFGAIYMLLNLKKVLVAKLDLYDINYKLYYNNHDISNMDYSTFGEIILLKNKQKITKRGGP